MPIAPHPLRAKGLRAAIAVTLAGLVAAMATPAAAQLETSGEWPRTSWQEATPIAPEIESASPFTLTNVGEAPKTRASVTFYPARGASAEAPAPAVILLHGAGGVSGAREGRYAREFASQGVAAAVIDVFGARGGGRFVERLMTITEAMALADAFATLEWLDERADVDASRVALIGFSYGGMSSIFAAYRQVVETYAPSHTFAAHVSFYGPCIARFENPGTTGAPILMLWGDRDAIMDAKACTELAEDLEVGGSSVTVRRYDAMHRWDGGSRRWRAPAHIADCRFRVGEDGGVRDERTGLFMTGPAMRAAILAWCANRDGYLIGANKDVRRRSNAALAAFLNPVLFPDGKS
jgi:dienelactone hydrolase